MAYCSAADIQKHMPHLQFTEDSQPTLADVASLIAECADNVIDPLIQSVVTLPVTDERGLSLLKQLNMWYVLAEVGRALRLDSKEVDDYQRLFDKGIERILKSPQSIQPTSSGYGPRSHTAKEPTFKRGERQW